MATLLAMDPVETGLDLHQTFRRGICVGHHHELDFEIQYQTRLVICFSSTQNSHEPP